MSDQEGNAEERDLEAKGSDGLQDEPEGQGVGAAIVEQLVTLAIAIVVALTIRQLLIEPFRIPSGSMFPTLLVGDHLFVNKLAYGPRIPFTEIRLPGFREPERGDVVCTLACGHSFHKACVTQWLQRSLLCPLCKTHALGPPL